MAGGGGISFGHGGTGSVINNTIYGNWAGVGGGFYNYGGLGSIFINCIFRGNQADSVNEIYNSTASISYCDIQGGYPGEGNFDIDPLFRNPDSNDFHLMSIACGDSADSPCIDMGDPNILDSLLDCAWGLGTARSDMGAYGGGDSAGVGIDESRSKLPNHFSISQNYPNPFNPTTAISYNLPQATHVTLEIYDILGRKVETLVDKEQPAGPHQAVWDAGDRASGIYFYRIQAGDIIETKRMLLLR